jgi:hypothetical protein
MDREGKYCIVLPIFPKENFDIFCDLNFSLYNSFLNKNEISKFILICKSDFVESVKEKTNKYDLNIEVLAEESFLPESVVNCRGWYKQQIIKLSAARFVDTEYYLVLDDDLFLIKPLLYKDFFNNDKVIYSSEGWPDNSSTYSTNTAWWESSCELLQYDLNNIKNSSCNMGVTPQLLKRDYVATLVKDIKKIHNTKEWELCFENFKATEFSSYWISLLKEGNQISYTTEGNKIWDPHKDVNILEPSLSRESFRNKIEMALSEKKNHFFVIQSYLNYPIDFYKDLIYNFIEKNHMNTQEKFDLLVSTPSDINEHLPILKRYAEECDTVVELGTGQTVSTWAFIAGKPKTFITVDILHPSERGIDFDKILKAAENDKVDFKFILEDSRKVELPECDLLFIDTLHNYDMLKEELNIQSSKAKKYIIFHDTISFGNKDEFGEGPGLCPAIAEFLKTHPEWKEKETYTNNNGLTVLHKI